MDDYIGELGLVSLAFSLKNFFFRDFLKIFFFVRLQALQRYRAAITLIHGLCQHAKTEYDKSLLSECLQMIQNRHATLWAYVVRGGCNTGAAVEEREKEKKDSTASAVRRSPPLSSQKPLTATKSR